MSAQIPSDSNRFFFVPTARQITFFVPFRSHNAFGKVIKIDHSI